MSTVEVHIVYKHKLRKMMRLLLLAFLQDEENVLVIMSLHPNPNKQYNLLIVLKQKLHNAIKAEQIIMIIFKYI